MPGPNDGQPAADFPSDTRSYRTYSGVGGSSGLTPATPFTVEVADNSVVGEGDMTVLVFPELTAALAIKIEGENFPRFILTSRGLSLGDGSIDPWYNGPEIFFGDFGTGPKLGILGVGTFPSGSPVYVRPGLDVDGDVAVHTGTQGFCLWSPNNTPYRIKVANDGTLSTEVVS